MPETERKGGRSMSRVRVLVNFRDLDLSIWVFEEAEFVSL